MAKQADPSIFSPVVRPREVVIVAGGEGAGKTFFAATAPGIKYVIGTEAGHEVVTLAKAFPDEDIRHYALQFDDFKVTTKGGAPIWFAGFKGGYEEMWKVVRALDKAEPGTVIIDSASDLLGIGAAAFNHVLERGDEPVPAMMYSQVYPMLAQWINILRERHHVILTARLKDEYSGGQKTGSQKIDLWRTAEYLAEHICWITPDAFDSAEGEQPARYGYVQKGDNHGKVFKNPTWSKLIDPQAEPDNRRRRLLGSLKRAFAQYKEHALDYDPAVPQTNKGLMEKLTAMAEALRAQNSQGASIY